MKLKLLQLVSAMAALGLPAVAIAGSVRFDFETGDLQGWQIVDGMLAAPVCSRATYHNTALGPTGRRQAAENFHEGPP
jgi:hypothetical protein